HVRVSVDDVEVITAAVDVGQHPQVQVRAQSGHLRGVHPFPEGGVDEGHQPGRCLRAAGGEERDVVAGGDKTVAETGDHALGAAVASRWHVLVQRSDLSDAHQATTLGEPPGFEVA